MTKRKRRWIVPEWKTLYKTWTVRLAIIIGTIPQVYQQLPWLNDYLPLTHLTSFLTVLLILGRGINQKPAK